MAGKRGRFPQPNPCLFTPFKAQLPSAADVASLLPVPFKTCPRVHHAMQDPKSSSTATSPCHLKKKTWDNPSLSTAGGHSWTSSWNRCSGTSCNLFWIISHMCRKRIELFFISWASRDQMLRENHLPQSYDVHAASSNSLQMLKQHPESIGHIKRIKNLWEITVKSPM